MRVTRLEEHCVTCRKPRIGSYRILFQYQQVPEVDVEGVSTPVSGEDFGENKGMVWYRVASGAEAGDWLTGYKGRQKKMP